MFALGDLSPEETIFMNEHLKECHECRAVIKEFETMIFLDLSAAAVLRNEGTEPEGIRCADESQLLAKVLEKAKESRERSRCPAGVREELFSHLAISWWESAAHRIKPVIASAGWAVAAVLLFLFFGPGWYTAKLSPQHLAELPAPHESTNNIAGLHDRTLQAERNRDEVSGKLIEAESRAQRSATELAGLTVEYKNLDSTYSDLKNTLAQEQIQLTQRTTELELARNNLHEEIAARDSLQGQLTDVLSQLEKQRAEVARAQEAADMEATPAVAEKAVDPGEAKEILGARDLHIVDVYDVDKTGKSARSYGRIYYVNHHLLVFYAFDLAKTEKNHIAAAFQAWGFRQPHSSTAESLGLFYLDNASLNRWTLRVSDPQVLSRIDTLFVTVERPGGSRFPRGRRLLMASLAGPANHP